MGIPWHSSGKLCLPSKDVSNTRHISTTLQKLFRGKCFTNHLFPIIFSLHLNCEDKIWGFSLYTLRTSSDICESRGLPTSGKPTKTKRRLVMGLWLLWFCTHSEAMPINGAGLLHFPARATEHGMMRITAIAINKGHWLLRYLLTLRVYDLPIWWNDTQMRMHLEGVVMEIEEIILDSVSSKLAEDLLSRFILVNTSVFPTLGLFIGEEVPECSSVRHSSTLFNL